MTTYHLFGTAPDATTTAPVNERVAAFLSGEPVDFDEALAAGVLYEFAAQERFRNSIVERVRSAVRTLVDRAELRREQMETPTRESEQYGAGYTQGRYREASEAAQIVQDALNVTIQEAEAT